jgi:hypothetical protein
MTVPQKPHNNNKETCPICASDLEGDEIPELERLHFGGKTHFSRKIAIYDRDADRTVAFECPDCGERWAR